MIKWSEHLYVEEELRPKFQKVKKALEEEKLSFPVYCITKPSNENNLFDIILSNELLFRHYKRKEIEVYGIAKSKEGAIELVRRMAEEMAKNGRWDDKKSDE